MGQDCISSPQYVGAESFCHLSGFVFGIKTSIKKEFYFNQTSLFQIQTDLRRKKLVMQDRSPLKYAKKLKAYKICQIFSPNNWIVICFSLICHDWPEMQFQLGRVKVSLPNQSKTKKAVQIEAMEK